MDKINKMGKMARSDWKRHSAPYDFSFDYTLCKTPVSEVFDQAMEALPPSTPHKTATIERDRKKTQPVTMTTYTIDRKELSTDQYTPGVLKIFGESVVPGAEYKSVLASCRSTAQELVKQALERFGLPVADHQKFVLCDVVGRYNTGGGTIDTTLEYPCSDRWERVYARILSDRDRPLLLQKFWQPIENCSRRYELHERELIADTTDDDDTSGLNKNARKILISKLRPGAIPFFNASSNEEDMLDEVTMECSESLNVAYLGTSVEEEKTMVTESVCTEHSAPSGVIDTSIPHKHPFFLNVRGFNVKKDKLVYLIKSKLFSFVNGNTKPIDTDDAPRFNLYAPDIEPVHCKFKVYKFRRTNGTNHPDRDRNNYFLEVDPYAGNVCVNGHRLNGKGIIKSGDILTVGLYYVFLFKDCSKGHDVPLVLPWLPVNQMGTGSSDSESDNCELKIRVRQTDEESSKSTTDESVDVSIPDRMTFAYLKDKEDDLVKYICAIIQQQNISQMYALTVAFMFSMCIEYASRKFERRQFKHLFLRVLFTVRESVAETAKSLSASKFSCTLLDGSLPSTERDQRLERLLLWISNCVQLLLFLKHTFQLPDVHWADHAHSKKGGDKTPGKEDSAKHALGQLVTGLEEIIMFCFQQSVYTISKALYPMLLSVLDSNPFSDANSEHRSVQDIVRMFDTLAEVTHSVMLHEGITRQLFTYLFFFTNTNVFNKLIAEEQGKAYYNWQCGVRIRANLSQLEDWATQNGLEDEFSQMFERLLAVSELLATSRNTLVRYQWQMMKTHFHPLTPGQLYHLLKHYQHTGKAPPPLWYPPTEELDTVQAEEIVPLPLYSHPPFALPDNCGMIDLVRTPEDMSFWTHLRRLKSLYGVTEDDSDSGFSISNTPRASSAMNNSAEMTDPFYDQESENQEASETPTGDENCDKKDIKQNTKLVIPKGRKSRLPVVKSMTNPWSFKVPKSGTGVCRCSSSKVGRSLADDMMKDERRENGECSEKADTIEDSIIASLHSKSIKLNMCSKPKQVFYKSANKEKLHQFLKKKQQFEGVANCSARATPILPEKRERSNSEVTNPPKRGPNVIQSVSTEDVSRVSRKPLVNASFIEAIEHGPTSTVTTATSDNDNVFIHGSRDISSGYGKSVSNPTSLNFANMWNDEVFISETNLDKMTSHLRCDVNCNTLPNLKSFKPNTTSDTQSNKSRNHSQKMMAVSFDSGFSRRSSIELTKDNLFVIEVDEPIDNVNKSSSNDNDETLTGDGQEKEIFPTEVFTEVSELTLATRKRFGSSINVAPSVESSPRNSFHMSEPLPSSTKKAISPSPLFTVYIQKKDGGLGIGLIDGLHTPLRLAGIYIRKILPDSPAAANGCLQVGDRLLAVDGKNVIGADYQSTLQHIKESGDTLTLLIARGNESMAKKVSQP